MKYKKIIMLTILLLSLLTISTVNATENVTCEAVSVDYNQILLKETDVGTFTDLADEIANANSELNLTRNYAYADDDSIYKSGIKIDKNITINGNGFTINGNNHARIFDITASKVVLNNICFEKGFASDKGGALHWSGENGTLTNCNFVDSSTHSSKNNYGGAVYWSGAGGILSNCNFVNSSIKSYSDFGYSNGGAVYWSGANGTLFNCSFINSSSSFKSTAKFGALGGYSEGGAVYWSGANGTLFNCSFINSVSSSNADSNGGAVLWSGENGTLLNCYFMNSLVSCNSSSDGGAIYWHGYYGVLANCVFVNSSSYSHSERDIYCSSSAGAVSWISVHGTVLNCTFVNSSSHSNANSSSSYGGAIYLGAYNSNLINCTFVNSSSSGSYFSEGGAIFGNARNCVIANCIFMNSSSSSRDHSVGGAIYWNHGENNVFANCSFVNSSSSSGSGFSYGGAVYCDYYSANSILANCSFVNSSSSSSSGNSYGGAVSWFSSNCTLLNCSFVNSSSSSSSGNSYGGAIYGKVSDPISIMNCSFVGNSAKIGGAASYITAHNCYFINNTATEYGGAMYECTAHNCIFKGNNAGIAGNNIYHNMFVLNVPDFSSAYNSGEKLIINSTCKGIPVTDANATINVYKNNSLVGTYYCLSGDGWTVNLNPDNYVAVVSIQDYEVDPANATLSINKAKTKIFSEKTTVTYNDGSNLTAILTNAASGKTISNTNIVFKINDTKYTVKTDSKGQAILSASSLNPGTYTATISYAGNSKYASSTKTVKVVVGKADTRINASANNNELLATLTHGVSGKGIADAEIIANINGTDYSLKTDSQGQAKLSTNSSITAAIISYAGNTKYNPSSILVNNKTNIIISAVYDENNNELLATLTNTATGKAVSNAKVKFHLNGKTTTVKTNSKGQAKLSTVGLPLGTNTATILYAGNSKYNPASTSIRFDVKTKVIVTDVYAYSDRIVAKLTNGATGKTIANANMIVEINGIKYDAKSDNKGQLTFNTKGLNLPSAYDLTISYRGNDRYTASTATVAVDLNKANMMITTNYHADKQKMVATLKNSKTGKAVSNANMIIDLNGVKTTYKSNSEGKITLPTADWAPGIYVGTVTYGGNARYNSISAAFKVDV